MSDSADLSAIWDSAIARIDADDVRAHQRAWINLTRPIGLIGDTAVIAAPNDFAKDYLESRLRPLLTAVLSEVIGREISLAVTVADDRGSADQADGQSGSAAEAAAAGYDSGAFEDAAAEPPRSAGALSGEWSANDDWLPPPQRGGPAAGSLSGRLDGQSDMHADLVDRAHTLNSALGEPMPGDDGFDSSRPTPGGYGREASVSSIADAKDARHKRDSRLNPKYTFDTFVIGASNRFPHAAAVAVAEAPARSYNPLFIYGDSGLGKTHLLHAIGHYAHRLLPALRVRYVSSEEFTNEFINSLRDDKMQAFQRRYREVDILLIDDIQFLERAERTQEEFFHTFNTLHNANKQIVISSDRSPRQLTTLEDRLRTRFEWGLITDVHAPDLETRIAILRKKAAQDRMSPPPEVLEFIATKIQANIRELEGALIRVIAFAGLNNQPVDLRLTEVVLKDLISESDRPEITAAIIMAATADYYQLSLDDLSGQSRRRDLAGPRQIAMYLCRELTDLSLPRIGAEFGGRDHTTVLHAERKVRNDMQEKHAVYNQVAELTSRIRSRAGQ